MSEGTKNLNEIYDDIDLCYKVMGLTFSDPPEKVDRVYKSLVAEYTKASGIGDPTSRQNAKANLEQVQDLYERITSSMIYKDYAREYEKYKQLKEAERAEKGIKQKVAPEPPKPTVINCPYCNKKISADLKVCLYCHHKILTPFEQVMAKLFTTRNIVVIVVAVLMIIGAIVVSMNPQVLK